MEYNYLSPSLLFWLIRRRPYDAYVFCPLASPDCLVALLVAKFFRRPFILWEERWRSTRSILSKLVEPIQMLIAKSADLIIVPGSKSFEYFATVTGRRDRLIIAPNASTLKEPNSARVEEFRRSYDIPRDKKVIVYSGRLFKRKGIDWLLLSYAKLEAEFKDDVFLLIAGEGEERNRLESLAESLKIRNIKFAGFIDDQASCISVGDVIVLPTVGSGEIPEIWGLIVNEAVSLGKPVVVTKAVGSASDIVKRYQCGYVVEDENSEELYSAIRNILRDPELALRMGANGIKATKEEFSYEKMAREFLHAVGKVLVKQGDRSFARK